MPKNLTYKIEQDETISVKKFLAEQGLSRREITRVYTQRGLLLNQMNCKLTDLLKRGDILEVQFSGKDIAHATRMIGKPDIIYEDESIVVVNKPAGMPCHPTHEHKTDDMGTLLQKYYGKDFVVHPVGRLDKDVSGLMVYAKNHDIASKLSAYREQKLFHKEYLALVSGVFKEQKGILIYSLDKDAKAHKFVERESGKKCITEYETVQIYDGMSLVRVSIITGRTHQIRAGMAISGHPLLGDRLYGGKIDIITRPALHCADVKLTHPVTKQVLSFHCDLPEDIRKVERGK